MGNCPTISHKFLASYTQWVSSPTSRKRRRGVSPRSYLIVLCLVWVKRITQRELRILLCNPSGGNLVFMVKIPQQVPSREQKRGVSPKFHLIVVWYESRELGGRGSSRFSCVTLVVETFSDRVAFRIPSNISDGASLQKQPTVLTLISHR